MWPIMSTRNMVSSTSKKAKLKLQITPLDLAGTTNKIGGIPYKCGVLVLSDQVTLPQGTFIPFGAEQ